MVQKILDSSFSFEYEQIGFVKFWKIIQIFAQEKGKILTHKNVELYEVQWSRLLHLWSRKEAPGDEKIDKKKFF